MSTDPVKLTWRQGTPAPQAMWFYWGSAVVHGNTAFFSQHYNVYSYIVPEDKWTKLPQCECESFCVAVVNDKLTAIGGYCAGAATNTLLCLSGSSLEMKWENVLPPMPTNRVRPAAVTTPTHLVVAGGYNYDGPLATVEALNLNTLQWSSFSRSPKALEYPNTYDPLWWIFVLVRTQYDILLFCGRTCHALQACLHQQQQ